MQEEIKALQVDRNLVKALRAGEVSPEELRDLDLISATAFATSDRILSLPDPEPPASPAPTFVPLPYERVIGTAEKLAKGDEGWIKLSDVHHYPNNTPCLRKNTNISARRSEEKPTRIRVLDDGTWELGIDPEDETLAGPQVKPGDRHMWIRIEHVVVMANEIEEEILFEETDEVPSFTGDNVWNLREKA